MNTRLKKVWSDLTLRKGRSLLTLAGLVIGLWGLGTVMIAWQVLTNDLNQNFVRTQPPNLVIKTGRTDAATRAAVRALDGVDALDNRPLMMARIENGPDAWLPLALFVVEDFQSMPVATFWPEERAFPPARGDILIERSGERLMQFMRAGPPKREGGHGAAAPRRHAAPGPAPAVPGEGVKLRLPGGVEVISGIAGTVFDPGQAPSTMERTVYGYTSVATVRYWLGEAPANRLLIRLAPEFRGIEAQRALAQRIKAVLNERGFVVDGMVYPPADQHPHQFQLNSILFLLGGVGALMLLLSVVLAVHLVTGLLSNQVRQIGGLKAIGARTAQVSAMYLAGLWLLGLLASAVALPMAIEAGYFVSRLMAALLNFEIFTRHLSPMQYAAMILAGSLFPVLAGVLPVRRWCSVPVRDALNNHGVGQRARQGSIVDRVRLPLPVTLRLGLRNSLRQPRRFVLSAATVIVGVLMFLVVMNVRSSLLYTAEVETASLKYDIAVYFEEDVNREQIEWIERFEAVRRVELWQATSARPMGLPSIEVDRFTLVAVPADSAAMSPNLTAGQWVSDEQPNGVVASHRFLNQYPDLRIGDRLVLQVNGRTIQTRLRGINKQFGSARLYLPQQGFGELTGISSLTGRLALIKMSRDTAVTVRELVALLENHFDLFRQAGQPLKVTGIQTAKVASAIIRNHLEMIVWILGAMALLMLLVSGLGMASGIGTSVIERTRELGVLRAIGATPAALRRILVAETLFIGGVAWGASVLLAPSISRALADYFGAGIVEYPFDYRTSMVGVWLSLAVVVLLTVVATWGPAHSVSRQPVSRAVAYE